MLKAALLTHNYVVSSHLLRVRKNLKLHSTQTHQMAIVSQMSLLPTAVSLLFSPEVQNANFQMDTPLLRIKDSVFLHSLQLAKAIRLLDKDM